MTRRLPGTGLPGASVKWPPKSPTETFVEKLTEILRVNLPNDEKVRLEDAFDDFMRAKFEEFRSDLKVGIY